MTRRYLLIIILLLFLQISCKTSEYRVIDQNMDFRGEMRDLIERISHYGKKSNPSFLVIPQNGQELITLDGDASGPVALSYVESIDGTGREDLFYGYEEDNRRTPQQVTSYMLSYLSRFKGAGKTVLVIDYCETVEKMSISIEKSKERGFLTYPADHRALDHISVNPKEPLSANNRSIRTLSEASNFLYLINPSGFSTRELYLQALENSLYDILIIDLFDNDGAALTSDDISRLQVKPGGGTRLVLAYMSIGEAEDYRYYWKNIWMVDPPSWLGKENKQWKGNYKVHYWKDEWQSLLLGDENAYLDLILSKGFDGVYLDLVDAFWYFENLFTS